MNGSEYVLAPYEAVSANAISSMADIPSGASIAVSYTHLTLPTILRV